MASSQIYPTQLVRRSGSNSSMTKSSSHEEYPSRPAATRPPRRARAEHHQMEVEEHHVSTASQQPQHHQLTPEGKDAAQFFDFFYTVIFSVVHAALTAVLAPVLGKNTKSRSKGRRRSQSSPRHADARRGSLSPMPAVEDDPESGMSVSSNGSGGSYQPILRTPAHQAAPCGVGGRQAETKKSVRFPAPERSRPPLGRIGLSQAPPSSVSSSSTSSRSSGSSRSSSSSGSGSSRRERSRRSGSSSGRFRTPSPLGRLARSRMHHSTYFLE